MQTARNSGLRSILIRTGYCRNEGQRGAQADFACDNLLEAVRLILAQGRK